MYNRNYKYKNNKLKKNIWLGMGKNSYMKKKMIENYFIPQTIVDKFSV